MVDRGTHLVIFAACCAIFCGCRQEKHEEPTGNALQIASEQKDISVSGQIETKDGDATAPSGNDLMDPGVLDRFEQQDENPDESSKQTSGEQTRQSEENSVESVAALENQFDISDEHTIEIPETWKRLGKNEIWVDMRNKQVILGGYICVNAGALEMFACPAGTKEHESVVGVNAYASEMHAALLAVGAQPGTPCSWNDETFTPASGSRIDINLRWRDEATEEVMTRSAIKMMKTHDGDEPQIEWIFGGSRFYEDPELKTRYYVANSGEMICVSNFSTAAIDVNMVSSDTNESLLFWANPETTPPRGTKVYMILTPGEFVKSEPQKIELPDKPVVPVEDNRDHSQNDSESAG
jgi:hypothetical protein